MKIVRHIQEIRKVTSCPISVPLEIHEKQSSNQDLGQHCHPLGGLCMLDHAGKSPVISSEVVMLMSVGNI